MCIQTDVFYENGNKINKGKGINEGLKHLDGDGWIVKHLNKRTLNHQYEIGLCCGHMEVLIDFEEYVKKELERIAKLMKIPKLPKKLIEGFHGKLGEEKTFYMDDKEILFVGYGKKKICKFCELLS